MISVFTYDLSFKVICDVQHQTYANHAISPLLLPVEIEYVIPSYRKSWARNPLVALVLTYDLSFKVIRDFQGQTCANHAISHLLLPVEIHYVIPSYRKSWSRNLIVILVLTYDLSFKVICDFQGQTYTNHAISPLLLYVEIQYVLPLYRKSCPKNPLVILVLTYDLSFMVIYAFQGQTYTKQAISPLLLPTEI